VETPELQRSLIRAITLLKLQKSKIQELEVANQKLVKENEQLRKLLTRRVRIES
jgi:cell shape-determining protein MreC